MPMVHPDAITGAGILPVKNKPARFAVGDRNGLTSQSWRVWTKKKSELYIACRTHFDEFKVSLHSEGGWRLGLTKEAIRKRPDLLASPNDDRAWDVWNIPCETLPQTTVAFHLYFPSSELTVPLAQRTGKLWKDVIFIEPGPPGRMRVLTLFITRGDIMPGYGSEPSFTLASFEMTNGYAKLIAHADPDNQEWLNGLMSSARQAGAPTHPPEDFLYIGGRCHDGSRFIVGVRNNRSIC
jgi:hypothetical protein